VKSCVIHDQLCGIRVVTTRVAAGVDLIELDLFYDYNCPFVYRSALMLEAVRASGERDVNVNWRFFSLTQINHLQDPDAEQWTVWGAPESELVNGRLAFKAAEAARRQGAFAPFHVALLDARHRDRLDIESPQVVERVAIDAGLDLEQFRRDLADPAILERLERDHTEARRLHGVFGTPTFVFPDGAAAYVRVRSVADQADAVRVFDRLVAVARGEPGILEIKRPVRPAAT
jgi:predicted DsbA family dithiol-disulfide isomerase